MVDETGSIHCVKHHCGPDIYIELSVQCHEDPWRTYDMKAMEERRSTVRSVRKIEGSCKIDARILRRIRGVVSNAD